MAIHKPLAVGDTYPNYKALCKQLGEPVKTGRAKTNQLEHWQTCLLWEKIGRKFKITNIIKPLDQRPHKQRKESKWYRSITTVLLDKLSDTLEKGCHDDGYNQLVMTSIEAYQALGLCNGKFRSLKSENNSGVPLELRKKFYHEATKKFYYLLNNALDSLSKQSIINYARTYRLTTNGETTARLATKEESEIIKEIVDGLLKRYGLKNEFDVIFRHKEEEFYNDLTALFEQQGFYRCYKVYRISFTVDSLPRCNEFMDSKAEVTSARLDINTKAHNDLTEKFELLARGGNDADTTVDFFEGVRNYDEHFAIFSDIQKLIELTIPLVD
jgi:glycerophosphoryl diester phosphodiesterase